MDTVPNHVIEKSAIDWIIERERKEGRRAEDCRGKRPADVYSPPRLIEVKAFGGTARGQILWLEEAQVREARGNPDFWLYVVDNIRQGDSRQFGLITFSQTEVLALLDRGRQHVHWEATLPTEEYDRKRG
jgi:hypothetical protein